MKYFKFKSSKVKEVLFKRNFTYKTNVETQIKWGYNKLPDKFSKFTTKCLRKCQDCSKMLSCVDKRAILQPIPKYVWIFGASMMIVPFTLVLFPNKFLQILSRTFDLEEPSTERKEIYSDLVNRMELKYPERLHFLESKNIQYPTAFGSDSIFGSVIVLPNNLVMFYDNNMRIEFENINVPLSELSRETREYILKRSGVLIPFKNELNFVIGHEIGHIKKSHSLDVLLGIISSVTISHFTLKFLNNFISSNLNRTPLNTSLNYILSLTLGISVGVFIHQWKREIQADLESIHQLGNIDDALNLADMKAEQNKFIKRYKGDFNILDNGDNLFHLEHPPPSIQKKYLLYTKHHSN